MEDCVNTEVSLCTHVHTGTKCGEQRCVDRETKATKEF